MKLPRFFPLTWMLFITVFIWMPAHASLHFEADFLEHTASPTETSTTFSFDFTNEGPSTVKITDIKSSCGCTVPKLEKHQYAPEEKGQLDIIFNYKNSTGHQEKYITVKTSDGNSYRLSIIVEIPCVIDIAPHILRWKNADFETWQSAQISLLNGMQLSQPSLTRVPDSVLAKLYQDEDGQWKLRVRPAKFMDRMTRKIVLETSDSAGNTYATSLFVFVR